jgi:ribosomal protein S18 acetylase RimI-like enzyme
MAIQVRRAEDSDVQALADFALALAHVHKKIDARRFVVPEINAFLEFFESELARAETVLLIAEDRKIPVGYAFVRMEAASIEALSEPSAWLHDLYVDPQFRNQGVGRQLISKAIEAARRLGSRSLMLGVSPANASAIRLYERLGLRATMIEMRLDLE